MLLFVIFANILSVAVLNVAGQEPAFLQLHPVNFNPIDATFYCNYNATVCSYFAKIVGGKGWSVVVNEFRRDFAQDTPRGGINAFPKINRAVLQSGVLSGIKCLIFSTFTNRHELNWALSIRNRHRETIVALPGNRKVAKKLTIGKADKDYIISFYLYGFENHGKPTSGIAYIGLVYLLNGPCEIDKKSLNCTFDDGFCNWEQHNGKYNWYKVPFGLHHTLPHTIEWGGLAAFAGKGGIWSPVVRPFVVKCFSFIYARGEGSGSFLRVWILYRIPGVKDVKVLLYEDDSGKKILKKEVQIGIFVPYNFQIAFEGRSKTILHGVIVLNTAISTHLCDNLLSYYDKNAKEVTPQIPTTDASQTESSTERSTTPTTAFTPIS